MTRSGNKNYLLNNVFANVAQAILSAAIMFGLYRLINSSLGVELLGVWSVVFATVSISRLVEFGLSAALMRFIARDLARNNPDRAAVAIDTVMIALLIVVAILIPITKPVFEKMLALLFNNDFLDSALQLLPYALVSVFLTVGAGVSQGGLDGIQRMDIRAGIVLCGQALLFGLSALLMPEYGLLGLAWAQIAQGVFLCIVGRIVLSCYFPSIRFYRFRWSSRVLREMLRYGLNVQVAAIFMLLFESLTKMMMVRFGGAASAGYFEMANQAILKTRSVIVSANRAIVPHVASLKEMAPENISSLYHKNLRILSLISLPIFALLAAYSPLLSIIILNQVQNEFVFLMVLLSFAWAVNTLCAPAYFVNMGSGAVGKNTFSHAIIGLLNLTLGLLLGIVYGATGVAVAFSVSLILGSLFLVFSFTERNSGEVCRQSSKNWFILPITCIPVALLSLALPSGPLDISSLTIIAFILAPPLLLGLAAWLHPGRIDLQRFLFARA